MAACFGCWQSWVSSPSDRSRRAATGVALPLSSPPPPPPRFGGDSQWAETGDRYLLKLFRDYLFHQVLPSGGPWVDLGHVVQTLNKVGSCRPLASRPDSSLGPSLLLQNIVSGDNGTCWLAL